MVNTEDFYIAIIDKSRKWYCRDEGTMRKESEGRTQPSGSLYTNRMWVAIHLRNMALCQFPLVRIELEIINQIKRFPDRKIAYDLFMRPFRQGGTYEL